MSTGEDETNLRVRLTRELALGARHAELAVLQLCEELEKVLIENRHLLSDRTALAAQLAAARVERDDARATLALHGLPIPTSMVLRG